MPCNAMRHANLHALCLLPAQLLGQRLTHTPPPMLASSPLPPFFPSCCAAGQYQQAVGVALEGRRLDMLGRVIGAAGASQGEVLRYALTACQRLLVNRDFRQQVGGAGAGTAVEGTAQGLSGWSCMSAGAGMLVCRLPLHPCPL